MVGNHLQAPRDERGRHVVLPPAMRAHMWVKGQPSPNPSGKSGEFQRCRSLCRDASYDAAQELIRLGLESEDERVRFMANSWVYERAWGKPKDYDPHADHDSATTAIEAWQIGALFFLLLAVGAPGPEGSRQHRRPLRPARHDGGGRGDLLLRVDVGDDHLACDRGRRDVHGAAADAACADDDQMVVSAQMVARLLQRREGGDAGAGVGRGEALRHSFMR